MGARKEGIIVDNTPVITLESASKLNAKVKEIDTRLFLCCNYRPGPSTTTEEGWYLQAVHDLYNFTFDTSCVISKWYDFIPKDQKKSFNNLNTILEKIELLRAIVSHNQSEENGNIQQTRLKEYQYFLSSKINKNRPENPDDYKKLNVYLQAIANELLKTLEKFVDFIAKQPDENKKEIVEKWVEKTLEWYTGKTKIEIYKGQLINYFISRAPDLRNETRGYVINRKVNQWIETAVFYEYDFEIKNLNSYISQTDHLLSSPLHIISFDQREKLLKQKEAWNDALQKCQEKKAQLQSKIDAVSGSKEYQTVYYFYDHIKDQLIATMKCLEKEKKEFSMLPQDLMMAQIDSFFGSVPLPMMY